jgi:site-specific DNA recombinase
MFRAPVSRLFRPKRILAYARGSSAAQALGSSLENQQASIRSYTTATYRHDITRAYVEAESSVHEKFERREQIQLLLRDVRAGDLVVVDKLDRWSRDAEFTYGSIRRILEAGARFYAVSDGCDPATSDGDTMLSVRVLVAREEAKRIKERLVGTRRILRDQGMYCEGLPPYGYARASGRTAKDPEKNILQVVPDAAEKVRQAFKLCIAGNSLSTIATKLELARDRLHDVLRCRVYLGEITNSSGEWIKARHKAIVDVDTFTRAQTALDSRRLGHRQTHEVSETNGWLLRDVAVCGKCGARMSAAYAGPHGEGRRHYYRCFRKCTSRYVPVRKVEQEAEPMILARLAELRSELAKEPEKEPTKLAADIVGRRAKVQQKRGRFLEAFGDGLMTREELRSRMAKLDTEALALDALEQAERRPNPLDDVKVRRSVLAHLAMLAAGWGAATPEVRREMVTTLATSVGLTAGSPPSFIWKTAEELI